MRGFVVSAAVVAGVVMLSGCGGGDGGDDAKSGGSSAVADTAACEKAVTEQVKKSMGGDKAARDAEELPASCAGLDEATKEKIAERAAGAAIADALGGDEKESSQEPDAKADVKITACSKDEFGYPVAKLEVVNSTDKTQDMNVQVSFNGADGTRLAEGGTIVTALEPGQKAKEDAMGLKEISGKFTCKVGSVDRWESQ
ncbi:hypothetical protein KYY02_19290 [Streptomyces pimonensis]|uniref:Lipoprotein n=1 Tax=Streptomyces pimonensis TaxID=2860288 RepID=A0ABV4J1E3_9ACTN